MTKKMTPEAIAAKASARKNTKHVNEHAALLVARQHIGKLNQEIWNLHETLVFVETKLSTANRGNVSLRQENDIHTKNGQSHKREIARLIALIGDAESRTEQLSRAYNLMRGANEGLESKVKAMEAVPLDSQPIKPMDYCLSPQEVMELKDRYERAIKGLQSENAELRTSVDVGEIMGIELRVRIEGLTDHIIYLNRLLTEE